MPRRLVALLGAGLLAAVVPAGAGAQESAAVGQSGSPLELLAPGRVLTVIVPRRPAGMPHSRVAGKSLDSTDHHRELVQRFAEENFLDVAWVEVDRWDALVPALVAGKGDLVAADITVTEQRRRMVDFTVPVHRMREHIVVRRGDRIESLGDLAGREIAIRERSSFWHVAQRARRSHPDIQVRLVRETTPPDRMLRAVAEGTLDTAVVDIDDWIRVEDRWPTLRIVAQPTGTDVMAWAVRRNAPVLLGELDRFLKISQLSRLAYAERYGDLAEIRESGVLRVITRNSAVTFFLWRGEQMGFEFELLREFARRHELHVEVVVAPRHASLFDLLRRGAGDIAAASLPTDAAPRASGIVMTKPFNYVYDYLVARHDDDTILEFDDLVGRAVTVRPSSAHWHTLQRLRDAGLKFDIQPAPEDAETESLIAAVGEGRIDLTAAPSHVFDLELSYRTDVRKAFTLRGPVALGWAVRDENPELLAALNEFLDKEYRGLFFNVVYQKYFENPARMRAYREDRVDHAHADVLSPYDDIVKREAAKHDFDWPLIVAQMYQESRFRRKARSPAGAIGLMQLLPRTARQFGVTNLRDPEESIRGGTAYLAWLHNRFEPELSVKDRIWFALAAYNAGFGHVRDARQLAGELGLDPNRWFGNVEEAMLLLSKRRYYRKSAFGYVRGHEVASYVRQIRERYRSYLQTTDVHRVAAAEPAVSASQ